MIANTGTLHARKKRNSRYVPLWDRRSPRWHVWLSPQHGKYRSARPCSEFILIAY